MIKINKAVDCPGEARQDWRIIQDIAKALGRERGLHLRQPARDLRRAARRVAGRRRRLLRHHLREDRAADRRLLALPGTTRRQPIDHPGTPRLFEPGSWNPVAKGAGPFYFPDGKARFNVDAVRGRRPRTSTSEYPIILTTGRVVSQFLSGNQTRRIGPLVDQYPEPRIEMHPRLAAQLGIADGDWVTVESRRGSCTLRAPGGDDDPPGHGVRPVPLGRARRASTS